MTSFLSFFLCFILKRLFEFIFVTFPSFILPSFLTSFLPYVLPSFLPHFLPSNQFVFLSNYLVFLFFFLYFISVPPATKESLNLFSLLVIHPPFLLPFLPSFLCLNLHLFFFLFWSPFCRLFYISTLCLFNLMSAYLPSFHSFLPSHFPSSSLFCSAYTLHGVLEPSGPFVTLVI